MFLYTERGTNMYVFVHTHRKTVQNEQETSQETRE